MLVAEGGVWPGPWRPPTPTMPVAEGHIPVYPYHPEPTTALSAHEKAPTSGSSSTPLPHNRFYLNSAIFQVENALFKLPLYMLATGSPLFRDLFLLPQSDTLWRVR